MADRRIVLNRIRTPDGTVLTSYHVHDYQTHEDKNGFKYMVDGGTEYLRRNVVKEAPGEELSVYSDAPFEVIRESYHWGTCGGGCRVWVPIRNLEDDHIKNILLLNYVHPLMVSMLKKELKYRKDHPTIPDPEPKKPSKKPRKKVV